MIFIVTYTLRPPRVNIPLENELKASAGWTHYLDYTWLVATNEVANILYNRLVRHITQNDYILISEFHRSAQYQGWMPQAAWDWLNATRSQGY